MVSLEDISFSYSVRGKPVPVFEHFSASFEEGQITAVIGPSGCGKTTLLRLIAGLLPSQHGQISTQESKIGYIAQDFGLLPWLNVERNAGLGLEALGVPGEERREKVATILSELGLSSWRKAYPVRLSGGMRQRVAVARALAFDAKLILMDEPFSSLDALTRESVQDTLRTIQRAHHTTIILVTHSIEEAVYLADSILILDGGVPVLRGTIFANPHTWEEAADSVSEPKNTAIAGREPCHNQEGTSLSRPEYAILSESSNPREKTAYLSAVGRLRRSFDAAVDGRNAGGETKNTVKQSEPDDRCEERSALGVKNGQRLAPSVSKFLVRTAQLLGAGAFICLVWWALAALVKRPFLPSPWLTFARFSENMRSGIFQMHILASARRVFLALLMAGPLAWGLGLAAGRIQAFDNFFAPLIYFFHPIPKVAFLPILMLFLGLGEASKVVLMGLVIFGQLFVTGRDAAKSIAPALLDSVRILGFSRFGIVRLTILPATAPALMSALRISMGTAIAVLFLAETFASVDGLGWYIMDAWSRVNYPDMYAAILALSLFGLLLYLVIDGLEAWLLVWRQNG